MGTGKYVLDEHGNPAEETNLLTWGRWFEDCRNRQIATHVVGEVRVSTVFLGLDHSFGEGPPILWETLVFGGQHDQEMWRYASKEEAIENHKTVVAMIEAEKG